MPINLREIIGIDEITTSKGGGLGRALIAEALGTFFINYFGCMTCIDIAAGRPQNPVMVALAFGFVVAIAVQALGHISGAHINPAISFGFLVAGRISVIRCVLYVFAQCIGAIAGSTILKALTPSSLNDKIGTSGLNDSLEVSQGFGIEFFLGFLLVLVVFGVCDPNKTDVKVPAALTIGLAVAVGHLAAMDYTGASMNPARSLGSSVAGNDWKDHWVFWLGPILGGIAAALVYTWVLAAPNVEYSPVSANNDVNLKRLDGKNDDSQP